MGGAPVPPLTGADDAEMRLAFSATPIAVRQALAAIMRDLRPMRLEHEERGSVELVLAEVLNNVVEHAYGAQGGWVDLQCQRAPDGLWVRIRDRGDPMPEGEIPLGDLADGRNAMIDMPEGGFGWFIIRDIARDIDYRREGGENILTFRIAVGMALRVG